MTTTENFKTKLSNSISFKLAVIVFLILLIQIPLSYVKDIIYERQQLQHQAQVEISDRWGGDQYIGAPILNTYSIHSTIQNTYHKNDNTNYQISHSTQASSFDIKINLQAEKRYLGIYEAAIYVAKINMSGVIIRNKATQDTKGDLKLFIPIKQIKGLKSLNKISINTQTLDSLPQQKTLNEIVGFEIDLAGFSQHEKLSYEIELTLVGSGQLDILPLARKTIVEMQSNWNSPSFIGDSLPDKRNITSEGFSATWHLNNFIQNIAKDTITRPTHTNNFIMQQELPSIGVKILIPANIYQVNERTVKYSFLIVLLTFAGFFLAELFFKLRLHPFQYLLIGISLSVFYLLLLSLSEYLLFNLAFMISASSIIILITGYCSVVLQQRSRGIYTGILFAILYGFIFILVKAEEASLLMGAIGIWLVLALVMYLTRKIDWYRINVSASDNIK